MAAKLDIGQQWVWLALRPHLPAGTKLTCVLRDSQHQLDVIVGYAKKEGYVFAKPPTLADRSTWFPAFEHLRSKDYKIAEPGRSMHEKGLAYDFSGPDLQKIYDAILDSAKKGRIRLVKKPNNLILEKRNRCVHAEIEAFRDDSAVFSADIAYV